MESTGIFVPFADLVRQDLYQGLAGNNLLFSYMAGDEEHGGPKGVMAPVKVLGRDFGFILFWIVVCFWGGVGGKFL